MTPAAASSRRPWLTIALAGPAIVVAIVIIALESYRVIQPQSILFTEPPASSLADALMHREVELAYAFVHDGADPNAMLVVEDARLTGGRRVEVSPLMLAVGSQNRNAVMMLLSAGADVDLPENQPAACLARELGEGDLETMIVRGSRASARPECGPTDRAAPLLLRYARSN
jgi:hypothetical protein